MGSTHESFSTEKLQEEWRLSCNARDSENSFLENSVEPITVKVMQEAWKHSTEQLAIDANKTLASSSIVAGTSLRTIDEMTTEKMQEAWKSSIG